ncbi:MAG: DUF1552 domain-containing protein [Planctomycetes bacterium]|nr:DUF1552 domain-containing protein [Planctomycetota bacterium]
MLNTRRTFMRAAGLSAASLPFLQNLAACAPAASKPRQRLVVMFSPNGVIPNAFWPDNQGDLVLKEILQPLEPFRAKTLTLHGVCDKVRGDGDNHMRGMGCLLTGVELFPGNIQGGSHTPAGWARGHSIDQEIKEFLQKDPATRTRFGSLEFGVMVPERADTWTRMVYSGPNRPVAPIDDPYLMFNKLYGRSKDRENLASVLDEVGEDLARLKGRLGKDDRRLLEEHAGFVRDMEKELAASKAQGLGHAAPELPRGVREENDNIPRLASMQADLLVNALKADFARVATLQFTNSVGMARMRWLGVEQGHHELSHEPDTNAEARAKLIKINIWFCQQMAALAKKLADTPEPNGTGSMLDHTTIVWTNELGKGNSHTLDDIPFVAVGGGLGFKTGRALKFPKVPHNRFLVSLANAFGHGIKSFGNPEFCKDGALTGL